MADTKMPIPTGTGEPERTEPEVTEQHESLADSLIEDISIDGMCGVY
ncbi:mycofactocin precursor MftA [Streptomyces sp. NPDC000618]